NCIVPPSRRDESVVKAIATTIRDIGGGGLAVLADDALSLSVGDLLPGCVIELPELGEVEVTLRVRHIREISQRGKTLRQAGCEFVDLPAPTQEKLFRYLMQIDRQRLARQRGFKSD
ncbi:MAG: PilZ domain-containing protein, partial [Pseudomonadota bacterium]|nr:PilZ domain-containing protein [Pseudomonadota bacterium]